MATQRFMIAPINGGLQTDVKPWLIMDDAFAQLDNAYCYRGRTRKRFGTRYLNSAADPLTSQLSTRLRINIGNLGSQVIPGGSTQLQIGQSFSITDTAGSQPTITFTITSLGAAAPLASSVGGYAGTINSTTNPNTVSFTGFTGTPAVYYYPSNPVTGIITYQKGTYSTSPSYAFDTQFVYEYLDTPEIGWDRLNGTEVTHPIWTGTSDQLMWGYNWQGATPAQNLLFVTNNKDPIRYWDDTQWTDFTPNVNSTDTLLRAKLIVAFKNHLVALSPTTSLGTFPNQARWAAYGNPIATDAWREDIPGQGFFVNASTMENIQSCGFVKDRLVVSFDQSTFELVYTGNPEQPFSWQKINDELGSESPFSTVPFDKVNLAIGNTGIHACNSSNVVRVDQNIPYRVWDIRTGPTQVNRVVGIRDYYAEQVYWSFPNVDADQSSIIFPNKVLAFNYLTNAWALFDESITAFGNIYAFAPSAITWDSTDIFWDSTTVTWDSGIGQPQNQTIIAGNQQGFVFICDPEHDTQSANLSITALTQLGSSVQVTCYNHNFNVEDWVYLNNLNGLTGPFLSLYKIINIFPSPDGVDNFVIDAPDIFEVLTLQNYTAGGTIARVPKIDIRTKQYNFFIKEDVNCSINKVDFLVDKTVGGAFTVDYFTGTNTSTGTIDEAQELGVLLGTSILSTAPYSPDLYPAEQRQDRLWHPIYPIAEGNAIQLRLYFSDAQMADFAIFTAPLEINAMCFYASVTSSRAQ